MSDKIDIEIKIPVRDKEGHYIMIKGSIQEEIDVLSTGAPQCAVLSRPAVSHPLQPHGL